MLAGVISAMKYFCPVMRCCNAVHRQYSQRLMHLKIIDEVSLTLRGWIEYIILKNHSNTTILTLNCRHIKIIIEDLSSLRKFQACYNLQQGGLESPTIPIVSPS